MRAAVSLLLALGLTGCDRLLGIEELTGPGSGDAPPPGDVPGPAANCTAQRVVHLVGGSGGLAWFTLVWPAPFVIRNFQPTFAYDDPALAFDVSVEPAHPLFARRLDGRPIWEGHGRDPRPSVFVAGTNETHTQAPTSIVRTLNGNELVAAGATLQAPLAPAIPVLAFDRAAPYGVAPGAPTATVVTSVEEAIAALREIGAVTPAIEQQLRPTPQQLATWHSAAAPANVASLAERLAFTANAFRLGLLATVIMPAFQDDPHGAFTSEVTPRVDDITRVLDSFYRELAGASEPACGVDSNFLTMADNTVLIVTGDTPKNSFSNAGWPDGTPGNSNLMYVRSNGFTRPGWFGEIQPNLRTNFDPDTGALDSNVSLTASTAAASAGALYAIARGDRAAVARFTGAPYEGVLLR